MGNRFSRRRDAPVSSGESAATEQKSLEEPAVTQPAQDCEKMVTQEAVKTEILNVVVGGPVTQLVALPSKECTSEMKAGKAEPPNEAESEPVVKDSPAPVQPEPLVLVSEPSAPKAEPAVEPEPSPKAQPAAEPEPAAEPQPATEPEPIAEPQPATEPEPIAEPQPAAEPEPVVEPELAEPDTVTAAEPVPESVPEPEPNLAAQVEADAVPLSESLQAPAPEEQTDMITQESLPDPVISSPALIDLAVSNANAQPINTPPPQDPVPALLNAGEPSAVTVTDECQDGTKPSLISTFVPERAEETSESLEKPVDVEAAGMLEQIVSDVNEETVSGLLQNLALKGNDLVADLIPTDVTIPDDTPIVDIST